ncbi:MAG TPA: OsmC family protein [Acidimicrobiales bacterium]|nr:OsmC family protein [Acidimicrobiales bacterium]
MQEHLYRAELEWTGSTGDGYRSYDRRHTVRTPPAEAQLTMTSDAAFRGDPQLLNPEQLLTAAASSCQLLSFLALAARAGVDVVAYRDTASARMPMESSRIEEVTLRPKITVRSPADPAALAALVHKAHEECYIARSLCCEVAVHPEIEVLGPAER